jgi:hypothetical protein
MVGNDVGSAGDEMALAQTVATRISCNQPVSDRGMGLKYDTGEGEKTQFPADAKVNVPS